VEDLTQNLKWKTILQISVTSSGALCGKIISESPIIELEFDIIGFRRDTENL
jgi:hypothetical protein